MPRIRFYGDWRWLRRWCLLGLFGTLVWWSVPVVKCSWRAFRDTPIGQVDGTKVGQADKDRVIQGTGFFPRWGRAIAGCYQQTPILAMARWKKIVIVVLAALSLLTTVIVIVQRRRKRSFEG